MKKFPEAFKEAIEIFNHTKFDSKEDWKRRLEVKNDGSAVYSKWINSRKIFALTVNFLNVTKLCVMATGTYLEFSDGGGKKCFTIGSV